MKSQLRGSSRQRPGFALAASLVAVVIIAALAAGVLFATGQEARASGGALLDQQTFSYAETAANRAIELFGSVGSDSMQVGTVISYTPEPDPPLESTVFITRLDSALYLVVAEGRTTPSYRSRMRRRVSIAVRTERSEAAPIRATRLSYLAWTALYDL